MIRQGMFFGLSMALQFVAMSSAVKAQSRYQVTSPVVNQVVQSTVYEPTQHSVGQSRDGHLSEDSQASHLAVPSQNDAVSANTPKAGFPSLTQDSNGADGSLTKDSAGTASPLITVTSSLIVVLGLFAGLVWMTRKFNKQAVLGGQVSKEAVDFLGSYPIDPRNRVCLLRVGVRVIVAAQTSSGMQPLSEITDPEEVQHLIAACKGSSGEDFAKTLESMQKEKSKPGFLGDEASPEKATQQGRYEEPGAARSLGRLFASNM